MMMMASHHKRESADTRRPQDIGIAGCFRAALHDSLMDRAQLIHMVTLVRTATGIQERIHPGNQQAALMHRNRKRPGKDSAGLPVLEGAITEQKGIVSREVMRHMTSLPDKATDDLGRIGNNSTGRDDKVFGNHTVANISRSLFITPYRTISKPGTVFNRCIIAYPDTPKCPHIGDFHIITNITIFQRHIFSIFRN